MRFSHTKKHMSILYLECKKFPTNRFVKNLHSKFNKPTQAESLSLVNTYELELELKQDLPLGKSSSNTEMASSS
jgi:hypothetical protein